MITEKDIIIRAREFAYRSLFERTTEISMDNYCLFNISKFLLLKESIIKKDYKRNRIYFDVEKNEKYLDSIISIVNYVKNYGKIVVGSRLTCELTPAKYNDDKKLVFYIKAFHKIRDSLAHGKYEIIPNRGIIKINNKKDDYEVSAILPIQLLERFGIEYQNTLSNKKHKIDFDSKDYKEMYNYLDETTFNRKEEPYKKEMIDGILIDSYKDFNDYNRMAETIDEVSSIIESIKKNGYNSNDIQLVCDDIYKIYEMILSVKISKDISIKLLKNLKDLINIFNENLKKYEGNTKEDISVLTRREIIDRTTSLIAEISKLLNIGNGAQGLEVFSVYNYMQTLLSFKMEEIEQTKDDDEKVILGSLRLHNLGYSIKNSPSYDTQVATINRVVKEQVDFINSKFEQYNNHPTIGLRDAINDAYNNVLYRKILISLGERNKVIIGSIRNAIDHGNVTVVENKIKLEDVSLKDNGTREKKFLCTAGAKELYDVTYHLDTKTPADNFNFNDMLLEINDILEDDVRASLYEVTNKVRQMNEACLLEDLRQVVRKR